jgi:outer membrane receptor protein involved in Fe transport
MSRTYPRYLIAMLVAMLVSGFAVSAIAQTTTATIRGRITNDKGVPVAGAEVDAVNADTGFVVTTRSRADGTYQLGGVTPGAINLIVAAQGYEPATQPLIVRVGQNVEQSVAVSPTAVVSEAITVVGDQVVETRTAEAATNVTPTQIESLPQNDRNFLNFATLAPGIRLSNDPMRKTIAGDAQPAEQTNVFIDGVSFKNDILQGGIVGQDASRGNPFPQNAVQEFRVITQNYSAQYDKASSAIITAITKSGGNSLSGTAFGYYQPKRWVTDTPTGFKFNTLTNNASYSRTQTGASIGGPIQKDVLHFFVSYEGDDEHATKAVNIGNPAFASRFADFLGVFAAPFKSTLGFGKLSWQPARNMLVDFSGNYRHEDEVVDFGGQTSFQSANSVKNSVYGGTIRDQWNSDTSLNQATLSLQKYSWDPTPLTQGQVGLNYEGLIRVGGSSTQQKFNQRRLELRDDYTFTGLRFHGDHSLQVGGNFDDMKYAIDKTLFGNPEYLFRSNVGGFDFPAQVQFGFGNPRLSLGNKEFGIYGQDNWSVNQRLNLTLGLRWDYETKMIDTDYVTPANIAAGLAGKVPSSYISTGNERESYKGEIQPRLGFSYDLFGNSKSVVYGGAGRYYDRLFLNATLDERFRLQFPVYNIQFSAAGGNGTVKWDPSYLTVAGLNQLIAQGTTHPEVYLLNNNTKPPYSNQWNLGIRQALGSWNGSLSYNGVRGYRGFTWVSASGLCCSALVPGFGNVIMSDPDGGKRYWYDGVYLTLDKPFTTQNRWGARVAWTHAKATQNGNDLFSLDYPTSSAYPRHIVEGTERDRIVATGIFQAPFDVRLSTIISLGTGAATNLLDFSHGFSLADRNISHPFSKSIYPEKTGGFADRSVDLRAEKDFSLAGRARAGLIAEGFNVFNFHNYGCLANFVPPEGNPNIGTPGCVINLGRRFQAGVKVSF